MDYYYYGLAWIFYFSIHSILASSQVKQFLQAKIIPVKWYRIFYNIMAVGLLIGMMLWYFYLDEVSIFSLHWFIFVLGGILFLLGGYLMNIALRQYNLGEFSGTAYLEEVELDDQLNVSGLNAIVRHPIYLATLLLIWGLWLMLPKLALLIPFVIISLYIPVGVYFEEKKLVAIFGKDYTEYQRKVPMIFPVKR